MSKAVKIPMDSLCADQQWLLVRTPASALIPALSLRLHSYNYPSLPYLSQDHSSLPSFLSLLGFSLILLHPLLFLPFPRLVSALPPPPWAKSEHDEQNEWVRRKA